MIIGLESLTIMVVAIDKLLLAEKCMVTEVCLLYLLKFITKATSFK